MLRFYGFHDLITFRVVECSQDVDASNFGYNTTLLRLALRYGHVEVIHILLQHCVDVNAQDEQ